MSFTASALLVSWIAITLLAFALAGVLARLHRLEVTLAGGEAVPSVVGRPLRLPAVDSGPVLALFVDAGCASCDRAVAAVADLEQRGVARVYWRGESPELFADLDVSVTPYAVVAGTDLRTVAAQPVGNTERLAEAVQALHALETEART